MLLTLPENKIMALTATVSSSALLTSMTWSLLSWEPGLIPGLVPESLYQS